MDMNELSNNIGRYFLSGALFLLPTALIVQFLLYISKLVGGVVEMPFLIAFPLSLCLIILVGFFVRKIFKKRLKKYLYKLSKKKTIPGLVARGLVAIDSISNHVNKAYRNPVLFKVDDGIFKIGFITDEGVEILDGETHEDHHETEALPAEGSVWIYAPYPLSLSGDFMLVEKRKIKLVTKEEYESLPLFVLSAGMVKGRK